MSTKRVSIDPITRLEGHGKILLYLDEGGGLRDAVLQIPELRGFERFCVGRRGEEMPQITERICGVCPEAHHLASAKALDDAYGAQVPEAARLQRQLFYNTYIFSDHLLHLVFLGGPDLLLGEDTPKEQRNILGVLQAHPELGKRVVKVRAGAQKVLEMIGGRAIHPVFALPGGVSQPLDEQKRQEISAFTEAMVELAGEMVSFFHEQVLPEPGFQALLQSPEARLPVHSMGLVDDELSPNFYDGRLRVVSCDGEELFLGDARQGLSLVEEHSEPWTYVKFPFLREFGWAGLKSGPESGMYQVGPLARLNVAERMATSAAQEEYERFYDYFGERPVHATFAYHWARLVEMVQAAEAAHALVSAESLTGRQVRGALSAPGEGVGVVEAARGTLFHHYKLDEQGLMTHVNLVVATTHNAGPISMSVKSMAEAAVRQGDLDERLLNRVEMAFRAYDPCLACATHFLPGEMPLRVEVYGSDGTFIRHISR